MTLDVHEASALLYRQLRAPYGSLNVYASEDQSLPIICVMVDPCMLPSVGTVPQTFMGFRVQLVDMSPAFGLKSIL